MLPQNSGETGRTPTGQFAAGASGNPSGRPRGLQRRTRELVGEHGDQIIRFWISVMNDQSERTSSRLEASKLLAERGWGKAPVQDVLLDDEREEEERVVLAAEAFKREVHRLAALQS